MNEPFRTASSTVTSGTDESGRTIISSPFASVFVTIGISYAGFGATAVEAPAGCLVCASPGDGRNDKMKSKAVKNDFKTTPIILSDTLKVTYGER